jgi:hypothetical protein
MMLSDSNVPDEWVITRTGERESVGEGSALPRTTSSAAGNRGDASGVEVEVTTPPLGRYGAYLLVQDYQTRSLASRVKGLEEIGYGTIWIAGNRRHSTRSARPIGSSGLRDHVLLVA